MIGYILNTHLLPLHVDGAYFSIEGLLTDTHDRC